MNDRYLYTMGQVSGYAAGAAAYFNLVKDVIGFIGVVAGAALSVWALYDRYTKFRKDRKK